MQRVEHVMGMPIVVEVRDAHDAAPAVARVFDWFRWVDAVFSTYKHDSQISRINRGELAVATSGEYARGQHVIDPHTRRPPAGVLSVTVIGADLATADGYATAAFAMGAERSKHWLARLRGYEAMAILADGRVLSTPAFPSASTSASTAAA